MPPKKEEEEAPAAFVFERDRSLNKFNEECYTTRSKIQPVDVPREKPKDPAKKLKDRLETYHNIYKMRTDYKNYVRRYGEPLFTVPDEIKM